MFYRKTLCREKTIRDFKEIKYIYFMEVFMDKNIFTEKLAKAKPILHKEWISEVLVDSIDSNLKDGNPRGHRNLIIVMEELAELSKEISKELRGKGDEISILEELADVQLCIYYIQEICGISNDALCKAINVKTARLSDILKDRGVFK